MAITLDHTEGNALSWSDASPAKGVTSWATIDAGDGSFFQYVVVNLSIQMDGNIDGAGVDILVRYSADSGTTDPDTNITLFNVAAAEATYIYNFKLILFNFAEIGVFNNTTTEGEVTPTGKWEGCKITDS
jgi:hypothetical protein